VHNLSFKLAHLRYVGCYKGNTTQYMSVELPANDTLTIEFCILNCRQLNKKYSIIQVFIRHHVCRNILIWR